MTRNDGISVVVCTYDDPIELFEQCIDSLILQKITKEIIVIDSSKNNIIKDFCLKKDESIQYYHTPPKGLSEARNEGVCHSNYGIVAFTDSDCIVGKDWAKNLFTSFSDNIAIVGGKIFPKWPPETNKIFLNSSIAQGFYSLFDMGDQLKDVEIIFGGSFAINKTLIKDHLFRSNLRTKENLIGGEETDLCRRVRKNKLKVIYNPLVVVKHQIPKERTRFRWMWKRMYFGGKSKILLGSKITPNVVKTPYNFYDVAFLALFISPYLYGLFSAKIKQMFKRSI